jgi:hypothetical protein
LATNSANKFFEEAGAIKFSQGLELLIWLVRILGEHY